MKRILVLSLLSGIVLAIGNLVQAQIVVPDDSPRAIVTQNIGMDAIRVDYSRPSVRGRVVFGDVIPYDQLWRVGGSTSAKLYLMEEVTIQDGERLGPGVYALYAIPGKEEWTLVFSRAPWHWEFFGYQSKFDALRISVRPELLKEQVETFTIQFANVCPNCAEVQLLWDFTKVSFRVSTVGDDMVMADIKKYTLNPEGRMAGEFYLSAKYYLDTDRDLKQAMEWIDKALTYAPGAYWMTHTKAEIFAKMGNYKDAVETAQLSIKQAKERNDADYVRINELEIAKWKELRKNGKGGL